MLPIVDPSCAAEIRSTTDLDWFHRIDVDGYVTPGCPYEAHWEFVAAFLRQYGTVKDSTVLEPGCADGLWTCWLTKLGARHIDATDFLNRRQFRMISQVFGLPATYYPGILSTQLPATLRVRYDVVCSLGVLYHVHDPLATLVMYQRFLKQNGRLILETAAIDAVAPYLHFTGAGEIYGRGNQFIPTVGFLRVALAELGITLQHQSFRREGGLADKMGKPVGRVVMLGRKDGLVGIDQYSALLEQLGMLGEPFTGDRWYDGVV